MPPSISHTRKTYEYKRATDWMDNLHNEMINKQIFILQFLLNDFYKSI